MLGGVRYGSLIADFNSLNVDSNFADCDQSSNVKCKYYDYQDFNSLTCVF